jgi:transitional endoplasmic reticulum ATPase
MFPATCLAQTTFSHWEAHCGRDRVSTELAVQQFLHKVHPTHHITRTPLFKCDLLGFAEAGYATSIPDRKDAYDATRVYKAPKLHESQGQAKLEDDVKFGAWWYSWVGIDFLVYEISYADFIGRPHKYVFVLAPETTQAHDGYHPATDRLLLAAGEWTKALHEEIYVFDDAQWRKDKALYKACRVPLGTTLSLTRT